MEKYKQCKELVNRMKLIDKIELKEKIDRGDDIKLVMVLNEWAFNAKHIPGSINIASDEQGKKLLSPDDEIVVYCSGPSCIASIEAYRILLKKGFMNVRRFAGGIEEWEAAGYPLEGN